MMTAWLRRYVVGHVCADLRLRGGHLVTVTALNKLRLRHSGGGKLGQWPSATSCRSAALGLPTTGEPAAGIGKVTGAGEILGVVVALALVGSAFQWGR